MGAISICSIVSANSREHPDRVHAKRKRAGEWSETHRRHEEQRLNEIEHGTRESDDPPRGVISEAGGRHVGGCEECERKRDNDSGQCAEQRDVERLQRRPDSGR